MRLFSSRNNAFVSTLRDERLRELSECQSEDLARISGAAILVIRFKMPAIYSLSTE